MCSVIKHNLKHGRRTNRRWRPEPHSKMERIGIPTGLLDVVGNEIMSGDRVRLSSGHEGIVLYHRGIQCFGLFFGSCFGDCNPYDPDCYGKFIPIPNDNGMRMEIEIINKEASN